MPLQIPGLSIFFNVAQLALSRSRTPYRILLDSIEIDCTVSETHTYRAEVTEYEVESGFDVSDHRFIKPVDFSIQGIISDTPLKPDLVKETVQLGAGLLGNQAAIAAQASLSAIQVTNNLLSGDAVISNRAFEKLVKLWELGIDRSDPEVMQKRIDQGRATDPTFSIRTRYHTYENMIVTNLSFPRDRHTGDAIVFSASFREIRTVQTENTQFFTPSILQDMTPFGQVSPDEATKPLKLKGSLLFNGGNAMSEGGFSQLKNSIEKANADLDAKIAGAKAGK